MPGTRGPLVRHLSATVCSGWFGPASRPRWRGAEAESTEPGRPQADLVSTFLPCQARLWEAGGLATLGTSESDPHLLGGCEARVDFPVQVQTLPGGLGCYSHLPASR